MDSELEEYLSLFKSTSETKLLKHASSKVGHVKPSVQKILPQLQPKPSYSLEPEAMSSSDELLTSSLQKNLKIYDLQELSGTPSDGNSMNTPNESTTSGGNLVFSLKDLSPSEASLDKSKSDTEEDTSLESFNFKANVFTVDDLVVSGQSDNGMASNSEIGGGGVNKRVVTERLMEDSIETEPENDDRSYKDDFEVTTTYKDDAEGMTYKDDFEDMTTCRDNYEYNDDFEDDGSQKDKESSDEFVDECIEEDQQVSRSTASFTKENSGSYDSNRYCSSTRPIRSDADTTQEDDVSTSSTDRLSHTALCLEDRSGDVLKTEVCKNTFTLVL